MCCITKKKKKKKKCSITYSRRLSKEKSDWPLSLFQFQITAAQQSSGWTGKIKKKGSSVCV